MGIPEAFTPSNVAALSPQEEQLYTSFLKCGEPFTSLLAANPTFTPPDYRRPLDLTGEHYWNTTVARKHPYWKDFPLPRATKDIRQMRADISEWGYCLIEDGLSADQCERFYTRLLDQADGEDLAGIPMTTPYGQYVHSLVNKGDVFVGCIEQNTDHVQAGPVIEQIMDETLGKGWICHSFLANGADPGGYPQGLHLDQGPMLPMQTVEAPALVNTVFIPQDVNEENGGTLLVPGSHKIMAEAGSGGKVGKLPPTINLEAKAGTIVLVDGRLLHGTGVNRTDKRRFVATMSNVKSWMRTQENWVVTVKPEVLNSASPKLLHRMGLQALVYGATIEGFGITARGQVNEKWGAICQFREAYDRGDYVRVGELSASSSEEELARAYTVRTALASAREQSS